jgi:23S rRNA G2069 N7-methylase RlmK/C1962 C5-methylase RlmI
MQGSFDVQRDHPALLQATLALLAPGGTLYFSNNRQGFRMDPTVSGMAELVEITEKTIPPDCRRHRPHRCWTLTH